MNEDEDGTGSPTSSSFLIQIPSLTSNNTPRDFNIKNTKIFYINFSFINFLLVSRLIYILHIIMTRDDYIYLIKDKFVELSFSFDSYCNQGFTPEKAFDKACKDNGINNWL